MIKPMTVFRRMFDRNWRPAAQILAWLALLAVSSWAAAEIWQVHALTVYWTLFALSMLVAVVKISYDSNRSIIEMEQKQLLRDLEKKHL